MRWPFATLVLIALVACEPPPPAKQPASVARPVRGERGLAGTYRLTNGSRKTVAKWSRRLKKDAALKTLEQLEVYPTEGGDLAVSSVQSSKGPYIMRAAGRSTWIYPLKKGWKVHVKHRRHRGGSDRLRVWVGPISVTYQREP